MMLNKSGLSILVLNLFLLSIFSITCAATDVEFIAGGYGTNLSATELNEVIDTFNDQIHRVKSILHYDRDHWIRVSGSGLIVTPSDGYVKVDINEANKINNIDNVSGYYGGIKRRIDSKIDGAVFFEGFSIKRSGELNYNLEQGPSSDNYNFERQDTDLAIDLSVNSLVGMLSFDLSKHYSLSTGGGYYLGSLNWEENTDLSRGYYDGEMVFEETIEYNVSKNAGLSGFGLKVGSSFKHSLAENLNFVVTGNYRWLHLEINRKGEGSSYTPGLLSGYSSLNTNGLEIKIGVSFDL